MGFNSGFKGLKRVEPPLKATSARDDRQPRETGVFLILSVSYTTRTLPTGKPLTRNSTWRSCDVCVNQFAENDREKWRDGDWILYHDNAPRAHFTSCAAVFGQTRYRSVAAVAILSRSRTACLFPVPKTLTLRLLMSYIYIWSTYS